MTSRALRLLAALSVLAPLAACGDDDASRPGSTTSTSFEAAPTTEATTGALLPLGELETVATGLEVPWGLAWVDEDTILVTERAGRVRVVDGGDVRAEPALVVEATDLGEGGLLGIALHPDFPTPRSAYLYYTAGDVNRVSRFAITDDLRLTDEEVLLDEIPAARFHDGGRIDFGPDAMLYVSTGDSQRPELAADLDSLAGKILRIAPDGNIPADNPFGGSPVWSYGHRNPQGLTWDGAGRLWSSEHGPSGELGLCCHDEINLIEPGGFYGWPFLAGTVEAAGGEPPAEPIPPVASSGEATWAPAGLVVTADDSSLLVATLAGQALLRFDVDGGDPPAVTPPQAVVDDLGRLRIASLGPDGCLYLATSNTDGRGDPAPDDDRIVRAC